MTGIESRVHSHAGQLSLDNGKTRGLEVTWKGRSSRVRQPPTKCAGKARVVLERRRSRRPYGKYRMKPEEWSFSFSVGWRSSRVLRQSVPCLLYTSDAADDLLCVDLG